MGGTVKIAQGDEYSDVHVGGVFGSASNATASACDALLSGDIEISSNVADGTTNVNVGGVCGKSGMLTAGCHAEWTESAHVKIASDRSNFGGVTGLTQAESNYAFLVGCYALCKGRVEIEPKNGTDYTANAGGIAGTFSGYSMIYPVVMEIPAYMDGCYTLVETDFSLSGGTAAAWPAHRRPLCSTACSGGRRKTAFRRRCPTARLSQVSIRAVSKRQSPR